MSFKATFNIEQRVHNILYCEYSFYRQTNKDFYPVTYPQSGFVKIFLESDREYFFESWSISSTQKKDCSLLFYKRDNMSRMKELVLTDVYCVGFREKFSSRGEHPLFIEVQLSAGEMRYGQSVYRNPWFEKEGRDQDHLPPTSMIGYMNADSIAAPSKLPELEPPPLQAAIQDNTRVVIPPGILPTEEPMEEMVLQEVVVVPDEPGFFKEFLVKAVPFLDKTAGPYINSIANGLMVGIASAIPAKVATYLSEVYRGSQKLVDPSWDGKILNCANCNTTGKCEIAPTKKCPEPPSIKIPGKRPINGQGKPCSSTSLKKVVYMNGIITEPKASCHTSKLMANNLCVEVSTMYNRTEGFGGDLSECIRNIRKGIDVPPSDAMVEMFTNHFGNPPKEPFEELNLMAHSQGGLVTQQSLIRYKEELVQNEIQKEVIDKIMSKIKVKSFGTAVHGWPKGPEYEQFTNVYDPIPQVISCAQYKYYDKTFTSDSQPAESIKSHLIVDPKINPISPHSMDEVYLKKLKETSGSAIQGKCAECKNP